MYNPSVPPILITNTLGWGSFICRSIFCLLFLETPSWHGQNRNHTKIVSKKMFVDQFNCNVHIIAHSLEPDRNSLFGNDQVVINDNRMTGRCQPVAPKEQSTSITHQTIFMIPQPSVLQHCSCAMSKAGTGSPNRCRDTCQPVWVNELGSWTSQRGITTTIVYF